MEKFYLEYIWLDGYETQNLRSKIKVVELEDQFPDIKDLPLWNFDGSSTKQAEGRTSECLLQPVRTYSAGSQKIYVLCEVLNQDKTPHVSNKRAKLAKICKKTKNKCFWWGFEQEYFITKDSIPLGFPTKEPTTPQGLYYCGVGGNQVYGRGFVESHLARCLAMGIELTGINAEVAVGQWEYQCFAKDTLKACDDLWVSRYILHQMSEYKGWDIDMSPKPVPGDWNGSGCHTNFSFKEMRKKWSKEKMEDLMLKFKATHQRHISEYGHDNEKRLTGKHETQHIDSFSWGVGDRGASIRIPNSVKQNGWCGYIEDRRPASNINPYAVAKVILETVINESLPILEKDEYEPYGAD
tara:strand:- start:44 stop:1102 length:1059 start_codon:yes stop_codon:yes gene_type:complete